MECTFGASKKLILDNILRNRARTNMTTLPYMITEKDEQLTGTSGRSDAMGVLAVWSARGRDLVPHLTSQTNDLRGFQLLVEIYRLWELYEPEHSEHAGQIGIFFLLMEQAFARTVGKKDDGKWELPGGRRVKARSTEVPYISVTERSWHLLDGQLSNGLWGLYRGASGRAELLSDSLNQLSGETRIKSTESPGISEHSQHQLFLLIKDAMDGKTVKLPYNFNSYLTNDLYNTYHYPPLLSHLREKLIEAYEITNHLAEILKPDVDLDHREVLKTAIEILPQHEVTINNVIQCENLLSIIASVFYWICAKNGQRIEAIADELPIDLGKLKSAIDDFKQSGNYESNTAKANFQAFSQKMDVSSNVRLLYSILEIHYQVSKDRNQAPWVIEEGGTLTSDVDFDSPDDADFLIGETWSNDYYLTLLRIIIQQFDRFSS